MLCLGYKNNTFYQQRIFMKIKILITALICMFLIQTTGFCQNIINIGIGPIWPKELSGREKATAWNATVEYGRVFDDIIGVGFDFDFKWNYYVDDTTIIVDTIPITKNNYVRKRFMFPISVFLHIDPIPKFVVHPVVRGQIGFNMMIKSENGYDANGNEIEKDNNGFYFGILGKAGIDGVYDIGAHAAVFAGFEYQWFQVRKKIKGIENQYYKPPIYGPGLRMGFSFLF